MAAAGLGLDDGVFWVDVLALLSFEDVIELVDGVLSLTGVSDDDVEGFLVLSEDGVGVLTAALAFLGSLLLVGVVDLAVFPADLDATTTGLAVLEPADGVLDVAVALGLLLESTLTTDDDVVVEAVVAGFLTTALAVVVGVAVVVDVDDELGSFLTTGLLSVADDDSLLWLTAGLAGSAVRLV